MAQQQRDVLPWATNPVWCARLWVLSAGARLPDDDAYPNNSELAPFMSQQPCTDLMPLLAYFVRYALPACGGNVGVLRCALVYALRIRHRTRWPLTPETVKGVLWGGVLLALAMWVDEEHTSRSLADCLGHPRWRDDIGALCRHAAVLLDHRLYVEPEECRVTDQLLGLHVPRPLRPERTDPAVRVLHFDAPPAPITLPFDDDDDDDEDLAAAASTTVRSW
jgi:hypothetical protein